MSKINPERDTPKGYNYFRYTVMVYRFYISSPNARENYYSFLISDTGEVLDGQSMWIDVNDSYGQPDYWWLRSPSTGSTGGGNAYYVNSSGGVVCYWGITTSYGRVSTTLRTPITTVMRVMWTRMVTSTTAIGISIIPTEIKRLLVHHPLCTRSLIYMKREEIRNTVYFKR